MKALRWIVAFAAFATTAASAQSTPTPAPAPVEAKKPAADADVERVTIADPYIELRTGPGRGYPVFFVASRGEQITIELRHTDWFRVRTAGDKVGWVTREQLETTLAEGGGRKSFRDVLVDDYLRRHIQLGASWGHFKSEPMLKIALGYRFTDTLGVEATVGQVQGTFSGTDFWHVDATVEPWSDMRLSPFFAIGVGRFRNFPNSGLVGDETVNANMANASLGARFYLTDRFVLRADYTLYTVFTSDSKTREFKAWTAGLSFFF